MDHRSRPSHHQLARSAKHPDKVEDCQSVLVTPATNGSYRCSLYLSLFELEQLHLFPPETETSTKGSNLWRANNVIVMICACPY